MRCRNQHRPSSGDLSRGYATYLTHPHRWIEAKETAGRGDDLSDDVEAIGTAVEADAGFVALYVDGEELDGPRRDVWRHRGHDVELSVVPERFGQVGYCCWYAVAASARGRPKVTVDTGDGGGRDLGQEVGGNCANAGAEIERPAVVGEQRRSSTGPFLALASRDVHARCHVQYLTAEQDLAGDPGWWLTLLPATQPCFERGLIGSGGQEFGRFLFGGDGDRPISCVTGVI
jgi:hypothetical protein